MTYSPPDKCVNCGFPKSEHQHEGACYGICGEFVEMKLPPLPWDWIASATPGAHGRFFAYLVDANNRKIAAIWGTGAEKEAIADFILQRVNEQ